jgi:hypothetical protein
MSGGIARTWLSRIVATLIGTLAVAGALQNGPQLITYGSWSLLLSLPLFAFLCSLAGAVAAVGLWLFKSWAWWIATWFCAFNLLGTLAAAVIYGQPLPVDLSTWLLVVAASLAYLFTPSVRASYRIVAIWRAALPRILGGAVLCTALLFGYSAYFVAWCRITSSCSGP